MTQADEAAQKAALAAVKDDLRYGGENEYFLHA